MRTEDWNVVAGVAAAASALFAGWQLLLTRQQERIKATFDHLREVTALVQAIRSVPPSELQDRARNAYRGNETINDETSKYLALLDGLELIASARRQGLVHRETVDEFLRPLVRRELISLSALADFRAAWKDDTIYQDLGALLLRFEKARGRLR